MRGGIGVATAVPPFPSISPRRLELTANFCKTLLPSTQNDGRRAIVKRDRKGKTDCNKGFSWQAD